MGQLEDVFKNLFAGRNDAYGVQNQDGRGLSIKEKVIDDIFKVHFAGVRRIGIYPLFGDKCRFAAVDIDQDDFSLPLAIVKRLAHYNVTGYMERSKGKGYHVWLFFSDWVLASKVRSILKMVLDELVIEAEVFPKQASADGGFGNYIYLPLFNLKSHNGRTVFLNEQGDPYSDQVALLQQIQRIAETTLDEIIELNGLKRKPLEQKTETPTDNKNYCFVDEPITAILSKCEYLDGLRWRAKEKGHLDHEERIYFTNVFLSLPGGREWVIALFSCLADFKVDTTEYQINSLHGKPTLCSTMCKVRCEAIKARGGRSPIAFAYLKKNEPIATETITEAPAREKYPPFPSEGYSGTADEFATLYSERLESPKVFFYFSFLTFLGCAVSPYLRLAGALQEQCRLYTVLVGPSASPRKSTGPRLTGEVFKFLELISSDQSEVSYFKVLYGMGSAEGLATCVERIRKPVLLYYDELRGFVDKARQDGSVLLPLVTTLFSENRWANYTKRQAIELDNAHLSMLAACTEETFGSMWTSAFLAIGFINRLFLVAAETDKLVANPPEMPVEALEKIKTEIANRLFWFIARAKSSNDGLVKFALSHDAGEVWSEYYHSIDRSSEYSRRLDTYGLRLMLLLAVSSDDYKEAIISKGIVEKVIKILDWQLKLRKLLSPIDADNQLARVEEKIRRALSSRSMTRREIQQATHASRDGIWVFKTALGNLFNDRQIVYDKRVKKYSLSIGV